jgi:putative transposase
LIILRFNVGNISLVLVIETKMNKRKLGVGTSWRIDETYIKVKGNGVTYDRAVDKSGNTVDFLLTKRRQRMSDQSFLIKAMVRIVNLE